MKRVHLFAIISGLLFCLFALRDIGVTPKYWWDEGFTVEMARTFLEIGRLDITIAPHTPSNIAIALNANGFPLSIPLASIFAIFGVGVLQARIFMLFWLIAVLSTAYFLSKKIFGNNPAIFSTLAIMTLAPFWANGRTATGDIPGLTFLLIALGFFTLSRKFFWGGIFLGLAFVTKTSLFHMVFPAITLTLIMVYKKDFLKPLIQTALGSAVIVLLWLLLLLPRPYSLSGLEPLISFYRNPINKPSLIARFPESTIEIVFSTTILYLAALLALLIATARRMKTLEPPARFFLTFLLAYSAFQTVAFLRSPGWLRYLVAVETLVLMAIYPALKTLLKQQRTAIFVMTLLIAVQCVHALFFSNVFSDNAPEQEAHAINTLLAEHPDATIGFIDAPTVSALVPGNHKYHYLRIGGDTYAGTHPLDLPPEQQPTYIYATGDATTRLEPAYERITIADGVQLYAQKH